MLSLRYKIFIFALLLWFPFQVRAQSSSVVREIKIRSSWSGLVGSHKDQFLIRKDGEQYLRGDQVVDSSLVAALVKAMGGPIYSQPNLDDLGITSDWLKTNASAMARKLAEGRASGPPVRVAALEAKLGDLAEVEKIVPKLFGHWRADDYPYVSVTMTLEDGTSFWAATRSPSPFMLPWFLHDSPNLASAFNANISRAIAALMPEKATNRRRLEGAGLGFELASITDFEIEHQYQLLDVESKTGNTLAKVRGRYTIQNAIIADYRDPVLREDHSKEPNLHLLLSAPGFPDNFSDDVALQYLEGNVIGTDKFLEDGPHFEKLVLSVPWLMQYAREHPKTSIRLSYFHGRSFSDDAFRFFSADMQAIGQESLIRKVDQIKEQIALVSIGFREEADWLIFPDGHMLLWRFYRTPVYGIGSGLPAWVDSVDLAKQCAAIRNIFIHCVGREMTATGELKPLP